jgi:diacylglycerol kinase family enzyme
MELVAEAAAGVDVVIVHGGDGTVNEAVNGLLGAAVSVPPALGVVPGGAANVFARALGIPCDPMEATHHLLQALEAGRTRRVGLGRLDGDGRWFTFNAGLGWDADVVARVDTLRRKRTSQALYTRVALGSYLRQARARQELTVDLPGSEPVSPARTVFVSNTDPWSYLGERPIRLNPECSFDRGLGVLALRSMGAPTVLRCLSQAVWEAAGPRGRRVVRSDDVPLVRVSSVNPVPLQVDGDHIGARTRVEFTAVPEALPVVA